jgi:hypothetical protein
MAMQRAGSRAVLMAEKTAGETAQERAAKMVGSTAD